MKTVFIVVTHGFHVRSILHTDLFRRIKDECRVVIFCPANDVQNFAHHFTADRLFFEPLLDYPVGIDRQLALIRKYIFSNPARNETANIFAMSMRRTHPFLHVLLRYGNRLVGKFRTLRDLWLRFESLLASGGEYERVFERYDPSAIITATYGTHPAEIRLLRCAKRKGVKTISVVQSWDNLSSKGIMGVKPDKLMVWGEVMKREAVHLHDYEESDIYVAGVPQFDVYAQRHMFRTREEFCKEMELDPAKKIILYGTITPRLFPHNLDIVEILIDSTKRGLFSYPCQIVVRLHPQVLAGDMWGDDLTDYISLERKYSYVKCDIPKIEKWHEIWILDKSDSLHLAELLYHSAVCLHPGSTLTVDAAIMDTPIIGVGFDGHQPRSYEESVRRFFDFTHHLPAVKTGGVKIAESAGELVQFINAYLENPSLDSERRRQIVDIECYTVDGKSGERAASYVLQQI